MIVYVSVGKVLVQKEIAVRVEKGKDVKLIAVKVSKQD